MLQGINTLMRYGVDGETVDVRRAALRGVANALLLDAKMRQVLVDTGYAGKLAERLKTDSSDDEMITSRILFLATYDTTLDFEVLIKKHSLGDNVNYVGSHNGSGPPYLGFVLTDLATRPTREAIPQVRTFVSVSDG